MATNLIDDAVKKPDKTGNLIDDAVTPNLIDTAADKSDDEFDIGRLVGVAGRGANISLANIAGLPADILNQAIGSIGDPDIPQGTELFRPVREFFSTPQEEPILGSTQLKKIFRRLTFIQERFAPETPTERVVSRTFEEAGALVPFLGVQLKLAQKFTKLTKAEGIIATILKETAENPALVSAVETGLSITAGFGAGVARELFPDSQLAELIGGLVGILGPIGAQKALQRTLSGVTPKQAVLETASQGKPTSDLAGNIKLDNFNTTKDAKKLMRQTAANNKEFIDARRGKITLEETEILAREEIARDMNIELREVGEALNAEELTGVRIMLAESAENVVVVSRRVATGEATIAEIADYQALLTRHAALQEQVSGATAEAGRALSALRITTQTEKQRLAAIDRLIKEGGGEKGLRDLADKIGTFDDPAALNAFVREAMKPSLGDKVLEVWINWLLSGPQTQAVNIDSNTVTSLWQIPERILAVGFSRVGSKQIQFNEVPEQIKGWVEGAVDGVRLARRSFATELPSRGQRKIDVERPAGAIPGGIGRIVRIPGRLLLAADDFFKSIGYRMELNALAARQANKEGLKGREWAQRVHDLKKRPTAEMIDKAEFNADYVTFTNELGPAGKSFIKIAREVPVVRVITPFIRTPVNIVKFALARTPFALLTKGFREQLKRGGADRELALARISLGTMIGAVTAYFASQGLMTGAGPSDPDTRRVWLTDHQPFSVKVGDKWISYGRIEPAGIVMGLGADMATVLPFATKKEKDDLVAQISFALAKNLTNKTFLSGISDAIGAVDDPDRNGETYIRRLAGTVVPSVSAQITRAIDPVLRDVRPDPELEGIFSTIQGTINVIKSRIPGFSEDLPARIDIWGDPIVFEGGLGPDIISPLYVKTFRDDFPTQELLRLDVIPGALRDNIGGAKLTREEFKNMSVIAGKTMRGLMENFINSPGYKNLPDIGKESTLRVIMRTSRDFARASMMKNEAIRNRVIKAQKEKLTGK